MVHMSDMTSEGYWASQARKALRLQLWYEQAGWCAHCDKWVDKGESTLDHLIPRKAGGPDTWGNCVMSCETCNLLKNDHIPPYLGDMVVGKLLKKFRLEEKAREQEQPKPTPKPVRRKKIKPVRQPKSDFLKWLDSGNHTPRTQDTQ